MTDVPSQSAAASRSGRPVRHTLIATSAVIAGILFSITVGAAMPALRAPETRLYDLCVRMTSRVPHGIAPSRQPAPITIVWIDGETSNFLAKPRMLWPAEFGEVLRGAATGGAKVIGLDYSFGYPVTRWDDAADPLFFQAYVETTQRGIPVILAYDGTPNAEGRLPVYNQAAADGNLTFAKIPNGNEADDPVIRHLELVGKPFCLRIANAFTGRSAVETSGSFLQIWYYGNHRAAFPGVHMSDVLTATRGGDTAKLRNWFQGRIVLIGSDGLDERHPTPVHASTEAVEIQANAISTVVQGDLLAHASEQQKWMLLAIVAIVATLSAFFIRWPYALLPAVALIAVLFAMVVVIHARGTVMPFAPGALTIVVATIGGGIARLLAPGPRRNVLEESFAGRVSEQALDAVIEFQPVETTGENRVITVMFCNLRGFAAYSAGRDPHDLIRELNDFLDEMSGCVLRNGGMVNKYLGDGLLALFGAPVNYPDHAHRAMVCALEMVTRLDLLNERRAQSGMDPWQMGIGVHTGEVLLGLMGAHDKLEYTVMGETLKVAERLAALNEKFSTQILLSVATRDEMGCDIATTWKGPIGSSAKEEESVYTV